MGHIRSLDGIKIFSAPNSFTDEEKQFNRKIVKKILDSKIWESGLFKHGICVLFGYRSKLLFKGSLGITLKIGTKECNTFVNNYFFEFNNLSLSSYEYLVSL